MDGMMRGIGGNLDAATLIYHPELAEGEVPRRSLGGSDPHPEARRQSRSLEGRGLRVVGSDGCRNVSTPSW